MPVVQPWPYRFALAASALVLILAACGIPPGGAATPASTTIPEPTGGLEGLNQDLILDNNSFEKVTPEAAAPAVMSQAEVQAQLPFRYALPTWVPAGFTLQDQVEAVLPSSGGYASVIVTWLGPEEAALHLQVTSQPADRPRLGAAGSSQAATVNGQPASLVQATVLGAARLTLSWQRSDLSYALSADAGAATAADLVHIAESIPPEG